MPGLVGVTWTDTSVAGVTVSVVDPVMLPDAAVIVDTPEATAAANPLLTVAAPVLDELHVTDAVKSCVVLSVNVPVAVNFCAVPLAMEGLVGVTAMDTSVAGVTVSVVDPDVLPEEAVIVVLPTALPVTCPALLIICVPVTALVELSTIATVVSDEAQVTEAETSFVVLSE
jgi:hypothetical protein